MKWEDNVRKVVPYVAGEQPNKANMIKLNTNECPYPPAPGVRKLAEEMDYDKLRLYPDTDSTILVKELADYYGVKPSQVFVGVGSDDVLATAFVTFFDSGRPILFPDITYSFYDVWADLYRIPYIKCALKDDWHLDVEAFKQPNGGVIFPNPNAPTGLFEDLSTVEEILEANRDVVVIVDEAYVDFGGESCLPLLEKYDNLLVVQTCSKSRSLAGARLGFAMGNPDLIADLNRIKFSFNPYNVNRLTCLAGIAAMEDEDYFRACTEAVAATRERVAAELREMGFALTESKANFLFAESSRIPGGELYRKLKEKGILVRHFDKPRLENRLRITVGSDRQMDALLTALRELGA